MTDQRQHYHHTEQRADDDEQPAHHLGDHRFDMEFRACQLHQFGGAAKIGLRPGQDHHAVALAAAHDRSRRKNFGRRLVRVLRLAGEGGLVYAQLAAEQFHIRRDDVAGAHADDVAGNQLPCGNDLPVCLAQHARADLQAFPQRFDDAGGAALLREAQHRIDHQQRAHHSEVRVFSEHGRQDHDHFEHPCRHAPELAEEFAQRVGFLFGDFVVTMLLAAAVHLGVRKSGFGINLE